MSSLSLVQLTSYLCRSPHVLATLGSVNILSMPQSSCPRFSWSRSHSDRPADRPAVRLLPAYSASGSEMHNRSLDSHAALLQSRGLATSQSHAPAQRLGIDPCSTAKCVCDSPHCAALVDRADGACLAGEVVGEGVRGPHPGEMNGVVARPRSYVGSLTNGGGSVQYRALPGRSGVEGHCLSGRGGDSRFHDGGRGGDVVDGEKVRGGRPVSGPVRRGGGVVETRLSNLSEPSSEE